jgi:chemotaxis protein CheZ
VSDAMNNNTSTHDSEDLEALFDSILEANTAAENPTPHREKSTETKLSVVVADVVPIGIEQNSDTVINQIGQMARTLHDTLRDLGLSKSIVKAAASIPDAKDRLNYVATLTENAAERVLNATEAAQPLVEKMEVEAHRLSGQWELLFEKKLDVEQFKSLVTQTQSFLHEVPKDAKATNAYLMEIMMAQDFQDLTGQVIKKIMAVTKDLEQQLLALLVENAPASSKAEMNDGLLNGPVINAKGRADVVSSQDQVDDLLESLGF